ncbi:MAG: sugar phosphate nucleotidyltransferase [Thermoflexales bacterium]|nr:sugar phosphate nucleotidyltransferase [Thermoflexales bacterium]MDW8352049.1 sugar phosphate nucleotidyltransferase [Anaerolineae bacterium]
MKITKAVITAAGRHQRDLPLQTLIDRDGIQKSALQIIIEEIITAGIHDICVVIHPGDAEAYAAAVGAHAHRLTFVEQHEPRGYGYAVLCAREFVGGAPFLHLVGDHLYVSDDAEGIACAQQVVRVAEAHACSVSAVQATRESLLPNYGAVGGKRLPNRPRLYQIDHVLEKPTPTEAEQTLLVPGLRAGYYLCFFGIHVLTPAVIELLAEQAATNADTMTLSDALARLAHRERYLAYEVIGRRYDIGVRYGLLNAQIALALAGRDRAEVLAQLVELLATGAATAHPHA